MGVRAKTDQKKLIRAELFSEFLNYLAKNGIGDAPVELERVRQRVAASVAIRELTAKGHTAAGVGGLA
jgi:hypothetical protein